MKIYKMMAGIYAANCYIYYDTATKDAVVFDVGGDADEIYDYIEENDLNLKAIFLTHGHADHIAGVPALLRKAKVPVYVHELDEEMCKDPKINYSSAMAMGEISIEPDFVFKDGEVLNIGSLDIKVIHTPGHTKGSCSFEISEGIVSGDTLFRLGIGRSDLYGGNEAEIINSIKRLFTYPDDTEVFPGHGGNTEIGYEKKNNPFVR